MCAYTAILGSVLVAASAVNAGDYFKIHVVDDQTRRGVPLVELRTVNDLRFVTDSNGVVAFREPGLMNQTVFFHVRSHGYEFPPDGFGYRGQKLKVVAGGMATIPIKRKNIAERLYRVTGGGIYRDSMLVGDTAPLQRPVLNGLVFGSDSVVNAVYRGKIYWFWGDTNRPSYPLGNFHVPGATSELPANGGLDPEVGIDLDYFIDQDGFARPTAKLPGDGPTWIDALVTLADESGRERLFAKFVKIKPPLQVYRRGLVEFDDEKKQFGIVAEFDMDAPVVPSGHPFTHAVDEVQYVYFPQPYPWVRVRARASDLQDLSKYEAFSCFQQGSRAESEELDRDGSGNLRFAWKSDTPPLTQELEEKLVNAGLMKEDERLFRLRDVETNKPVSVHRSSVSWNAYRKRWVMIAVEAGGTSFLGEVWYAEAPQPEGPWLSGHKIVTHDKYSFYNPKHHPMFDKEGGRVIFFEGTYTNTFSGNPDRTPLYDYNQVLYKLDLADPRLRLR